jgi:large subunit ribosomal protein L1
MSSHGKRYNEAREKIDRETHYSPAEALKILKGLPDAKFDETIEAHFRLGLNVRHADQQLRGTDAPARHRQSVRVAVFAEGDKAREAEEAGADVVGAADLAAKIEGGCRLRRGDRDARPDGQRRQARACSVARPDADPKQAPSRSRSARPSRTKAGKLEYRTDRGANVHVSIGKKSFGEKDLLENYAALVEDRARETRVREGPLHPPDHARDTMGPGVRVDPARVRGIVEEFEQVIPA